MSTQLPIGLAVILVALVITAAAWDLKSRRIPNWLSLAGIISGIAMNSFLFEWTGLKESLEGMTFAFAIYFVLYVLHAKRVGDAKLMAAIGALVGPSNWFYIFLIVSILGGVIGIGMALRHKRLRKTLDNVGFMVGEMKHFRAPYLTREELSVRSEKSFRLPGGAVAALGCMVFLSLPLFSTIH